MSNINWLDLLGWTQEELEDLRFVAFSYIQQGHYDVAITILEALLILSSKNAYDLQTLGAIYLQQGKALQALNYLDQSLKLEPNHLPSLLNRVKAFFLLGYRTQAINEAQKLEKSHDSLIAKEASALLTCYA